MAREKFQTLTEQMFYVLLTLREECCGTDVMARISNLTPRPGDGRPRHPLQPAGQLQAAGWIMETKKPKGRRRSYLITPRRGTGIGRGIPAAANSLGGLPQLHGPERRDRSMKLFDRQKKWEINLYAYYDHAGIVRHLEDMARQGWQLEKAGSVFWTYRRCKPTGCATPWCTFPQGQPSSTRNRRRSNRTSGHCARQRAGSWSPTAIRCRSSAIPRRTPSLLRRTLWYRWKTSAPP